MEQFDYESMTDAPPDHRGAARFLAFGVSREKVAEFYNVTTERIDSLMLHTPFRKWVQDQLLEFRSKESLIASLECSAELLGKVKGDEISATSIEEFTACMKELISCIKEVARMIPGWSAAGISRRTTAATPTFDVNAKMASIAKDALRERAIASGEVTRLDD